MKKVLFGIMALSFVAFAANPGNFDDSGNATTSVPVHVSATIIDAPSGLVITNESGTVIDRLEIDHGKIIKGKAVTDSTAYEVFNVKRFDNENKPVCFGNGELNISLENIPEDGLKLTNNKSNLPTTLSFHDGSTNYTETVTEDASGGDTKHTGKVNSVIPLGSLSDDSLTTGLYLSNPSEATLTVVYKPN